MLAFNSPMFPEIIINSAVLGRAVDNALRGRPVDRQGDGGRGSREARVDGALLDEQRTIEEEAHASPVGRFELTPPQRSSPLPTGRGATPCGVLEMRGGCAVHGARTRAE